MKNNKGNTEEAMRERESLSDVSEIFIQSIKCATTTY